MKVVHYLNQFFAGLGGEGAASHEPIRIEGAVGPGRALGLDVSVTLACGDDRFGEHEAESLATLLGWLEAERPDVLVCGPAFGAGRYGYACGILAREAVRRGIPVVTAMTPDSPGVLAAAGAAYVVPTGSTVSEMRTILPVIAGLARRLAEHAEIGSPAEEGYLPRSLRRNVLSERTGAARALELVRSKLSGEVATEVEPSGDRVAPPPPIADAADALVALVTEAGCVPMGNPDRLPSRRAHVWLRYPLAGVSSLDAGSYESVHAGFDTTVANADPNRLVPLDAVRQLEAEACIGHLHETLYTTTGVDTPVAVAARFGQEIGSELREAGVQAVIVTGTCGTGTRCGATLAKEIERCGIPTVFVTALPTIAQMVGANRILRGVSIAHPAGDPSLGAADELAGRRRLVERALAMLSTDVDPLTVWETNA